MSAEARLKQLGIVLPERSRPRSPTTCRSASPATCSSRGAGAARRQGWADDRQGRHRGVGDEGYKRARRVGLGLLSAIRLALGSLDRVETVIVKMLGMVNAAPDFKDQPKVINGCSTCSSRCSARPASIALGGRHGLAAERDVGRDRRHHAGEVTHRRESLPRSWGRDHSA